MRRLLLAGVAACPITLAGCYWLASYQDLTSGELGADGASDTYAEANAEGDGRSDGGLPVDAAAEVQGDGEGGEAGPFCPGDAGPLTYCMDFDSVDGAEPTLGTFMATASIVTGTFVSPPKSLFVSLTDQSANGGYSISFPVTPTTVRLEFQVRAAVLGQGASLSNVGLSMDSTWRGLTVLMNPRCNFHVEEYFSLADGGFEQNDHPGAELAGCDGDAGAWHHVVLTLTVDDSSQQYTSSLTVDEQVFEDNQPLSLTWIPGEVGLSLGVTYADGNGSRFYFDNIRVDFTL